MVVDPFILRCMAVSICSGFLLGFGGSILLAALGLPEPPLLGNIVTGCLTAILAVFVNPKPPEPRQVRAEDLAHYSESPGPPATPRGS